jgi:hypothetical protein
MKTSEDQLTSIKNLFFIFRILLHGKSMNHFFHISGAPFMDMVYFPEHEQVAFILFFRVDYFISNSERMLPVIFLYQLE